MPEAQQYYIGIDVGGTSVKLGLFDASGELLARESVPTPSLACAEGYAAVVGGIERLMGSQRQPMLFVRGIGLAIPCPVPASGVITVAANIEIDAPALMAALQGRCPGAAIRYVNDANAAAMGELWRGSARGHRSMVMVTIGTGLGGGVVVNGDVVDGAFGAGGEIGHMCVNPAEERTCGCGRRGCLEQYASATGVVSNYLRVYVIGGGASAGADMFLGSLRERFAARAFPASSNCAIEVAELGNDAGIFGAAYVALRTAQREA